MHIWSLHFGHILILVSNLILRQPQSLKTKNHVHFRPYCQLTNQKFIRNRKSVLFARKIHIELANKIVIKFFWLLKNNTSPF